MVRAFPHCCVTLFLGKYEQTPERELMKDQRTDTIKIQRGAQWVYWHYSREHGWGVTYKSLNDSRTAASPQPTPLGDSPRKLGTWYTAQPAGSSTNCPSLALPGWSAGLCFFQEAGLVWVFSRLSLLFIYSWGRRGLDSLVNFRDFHKVFWLAYFLYLWVSLQGGLFES